MNRVYKYLFSSPTKEVELKEVKMARQLNELYDVTVELKDTMLDRYEKAVRAAEAFEDAWEEMQLIVQEAEGVQRELEEVEGALSDLGVPVPDLWEDSDNMIYEILYGYPTTTEEILKV